jgi:HAD superfamily hydrolase (TIGR01509 family)
MMAEWNAMALEKYQTCVPLKPGAMAFLAYLRKTGRKMAICTSNSRYLTETVLCALHIQDFFDAVLTADDHLEGKPSPDIYLQACKQLETEAESCLVFEDIYKGVLAGRRADMKVCAVRDAFSEDEWPGMEEMADYAIRDFTELEPLFQ